jgi:hypothetical protein
MTTRRWLASAGVLALIVLALERGAATQALPDSTVKAALISRLPEFVRWPSSAPGGPQAPVTLCFSPGQPFGSDLQHLEKAGPERVHPVSVRRLRKGDRPDACHVLYVASADQDLLQRVRHLPVLTVGDQPDFCQVGGIVNLRVVSHRVRFEIDVAQARRAGLTIDSQLLRLAITLYGGTP